MVTFIAVTKFLQGTWEDTAHHGRKHDGRKECAANLHLGLDRTRNWQQTGSGAGQWDLRVTPQWHFPLRSLYSDSTVSWNKDIAWGPGVQTCSKASHNTLLNVLLLIPINSATKFLRPNQKQWSSFSLPLTLISLSCFINTHTPNVLVPSRSVFSSGLHHH